MAAAGLIGLSQAVQGAGGASKYDFDTSRIKTIYIVPNAHWDRGWYLPADDEAKLYKQHLDRVIETCRKSSSVISRRITPITFRRTPATGLSTGAPPRLPLLP